MLGASKRWPRTQERLHPQSKHARSQLRMHIRLMTSCGQNLEPPLLFRCGTKAGREARLFFTECFRSEMTLIWLTGSCCGCFRCSPAHRYSVPEVRVSFMPARRVKAIAPEKVVHRALAKCSSSRGLLTQLRQLVLL